MKALLLNDVEKLEYCEISRREPGDDEIVIDIAACGVCGTDLHLFHGEEGAGSSALPLVMGHEFAGTVGAVGRSVHGLRVGDHVTVDPNLYCNECFQCRRGTGQYCEHAEAYGVSMYGGFAEQCVVAARAAYKLPDQLPLEHAALVEPVACCLHGIDRANIRPGNTVAIIGAGSIGQLMIQLSRVSGAAKIIVIEPIAEKREKAVELGASLVIDPINQDAKRVIGDAGILSVDTVIECVGNPRTMEQAIDIASRGATVLLFGLTSPGATMTVMPFTQVFRKELTITSSFVNPLVTQRVIDLMASGALNLDAIITDRVSLENGAEVFTNDAYRRRGKILIIPNRKENA